MKSSWIRFEKTVGSGSTKNEIGTTELRSSSDQKYELVSKTDLEPKKLFREESGLEYLDTEEWNLTC